MKKVLRFRVVPSAVFLLCIATAIAAPAQSYRTLLNFDGANGASPEFMSLVQGIDGNLYGTTASGGNNNLGTVFKVTPVGTLTTLYSFCSQPACTDGSSPIVGLALGVDGNFYGTTSGGGANNGGSVFQITPKGTLTTLYSFCAQAGCLDGSNSNALVQGIDGNFYGTTQSGGTGAAGTVFKVTPGGILTTLYSFCTQTGCPDGQVPYAGLVQGTNGSFYGTTQQGGNTACNGGCGTVFKITSKGTLTTLHSFDSVDGSLPEGALLQATDGNFYGTTAQGGTGTVCTPGCGTVFHLTPGGSLTTLHSFDSTDGSGPTCALVQGTGLSFYGTTSSAGAVGYGTVFGITSGGALTTLHNFDFTDGDAPFGGLVQATNGIFYGTTEAGAANGDGTVFSLSLALGRFVETLPAVGKVGAKVVILGTSLNGSTSVTFNGTAAAFTVVSATEIKTTVPSGATTGLVQVTTPHGGTLLSNVAFRVK